MFNSIFRTWKEMIVDSHEFSRNQKIVTDGFMISRSGHSFHGIWNPRVWNSDFQKKILYNDVRLKTPYSLYSGKLCSKISSQANVRLEYGSRKTSLGKCSLRVGARGDNTHVIRGRRGCQALKSYVLFCTGGMY